MTTSKNQNFKEQYPVRLLFNGGFEYDSNIDEGSFVPLGEDKKDLQRAIFLRETFEQVSAPLISRNLRQIAKSCISNNSTYKSSSYGSGYREYNNSMKELYLKHPEVFYAVVKHHGNDFKSWDSIYNRETGEFNDDALADIPMLARDDFIPNVTACKITTYDYSASQKIIYLPVTPSSLFNGIAIAVQTGAILSFSMPHSIGQSVDVRVRKLAASPAAGKTLN